MNNDRNQLGKQSRDLFLVLLTLWVLSDNQALAQGGATISKGTKAAVPAVVACEAAALPGLSYELSKVPFALGEAGLPLEHLQAELAQIPPMMSLDAAFEFAEPVVAIAPSSLTQAEAATESMNFGISGLASSIGYGESFGQDVTVVAGQESNAVSKAYQKAYDLVLDKKWVEAQKELDNFISKYRNSSYLDAARYWRCYTQEKTGSSSEDAFKKYQEFVKSYPHSRWADDARTNMIRIGSELAKQGKSEYGTIVQSLQQGDDEDVKLTALYALRSNADEKSLPVILNLYDQSKSEKLREKILYVLGGYDSPLVVPKLADIAMKDPSISVRKNAVYALGNMKKSEASSSLKKIAKSENDAEIRTAALYSLANIGEEDLIPFLAEIAKNDPNEKLARAAVYSMANVNNETSTKALESLLKDAKSKEVRKAALHALANVGGDATVVSTLKDIAVNDSDPDMRRTATFALGNTRSSVSFEALKSIIASAKDSKARTEAVQAIGMNGGAEAREFLKKVALTDQDENVARMAVYSIGNSHDGSDDAGANFLLEVLRNAKSLEVKKAALYQFGNTNKTSVVKTLGQFLKDEKDPDLRIAAVYVLGNAKSDDAVDVLLGIARNDGSKKARTAAVSALSNIGTKKAQDALLQIIEGKPKE